MKKLVSILTYSLVSMHLFLLPAVTFSADTTPAAAAATAIPPVNLSIAPMVAKVLPAIVNIKAQIKITDLNTLREILRQRGLKGDDLTDQTIPSSYVSVGSGVIVDPKNGYILTNAHVVNDAQIIVVTLSDGRHFTGKLIGLDKPSDIGVIQIKAKNLNTMPIGDSNTLKVGDFVAAIGNPFGLGQTVTSGIVSGLGRTKMGIETYENFIQTDASINPGNSGGALINEQGQLVGINTAILGNRGSIGIGFAVPANMAKSVMLQLIQYGNVKRGVLGVGAQDLTPELQTAFNLPETGGAAVTQVYPDSPAQQSGLKIGDIITKINDNVVKNASDVVNTIGFLRVDSKITITILRDKKPITLSVVLSDPKVRQEQIERKDPFLYGVGLQNFSLLSPVHGNVAGVLVLAVEEESKPWQSDLRPGDVITTANSERVTTIEQLRAVAAKADSTLLLNVLRGPGAVFIVINKES